MTGDELLDELKKEHEFCEDQEDKDWLEQEIERVELMMRS
jgi:hypothetical protein